MPVENGARKHLKHVRSQNVRQIIQIVLLAHLKKDNVIKRYRNAGVHMMMQNVKPRARTIANTMILDLGE